MGDKKENGSFLIALTSIQEIAFRFNAGYDYSSFSGDNLSFGIKYDVQTEKEAEIVRLTITITYLASDNKELLTEYSLLTEYHLIGLSKLITIDEHGEETMEKDVIINMLNLSIGTLRGAFFLKMKDTPLSKFPIPLIPSDLLEAELDKNKRKK